MNQHCPSCLSHWNQLRSKQRQTDRGRSQNSRHPGAAVSFHASPGISWPELIGAGREPCTRRGRESSERTLLFLHWATPKGRVRESGECPELFSLCSVFPVVSCPGPQGVCGREAVGQAPRTSKSEKLLSNQKNCGPKNAWAPP